MIHMSLTALASLVIGVPFTAFLVVPSLRLRKAPRVTVPVPCADTRPDVMPVNERNADWWDA